MTVTTPFLQGQQCQLLDYGRDTIAMRATIVIATMAKMPVHQHQELHCDKGENAIAMTVRMPHQ
jgi:hypothetical protein